MLRYPPDCNQMLLYRQIHLHKGKNYHQHFLQYWEEIDVKPTFGAKLLTLG